MFAVNILAIKFVTLPLNDLFFCCWSSLEALATESEDLFCNYDALDLVFGIDGGGGRELFSLEANAEG
jgi:hypothetical protein